MRNLLVTLVFIGTLYSCDKENATPDPPPGPTTGTVTFYMEAIGGSWNLLIDGADKGEIDQSFVAPICGDVNFITLKLSIGVHKWDLKSNDGLAWGNPTTFQVMAGCTTIRAIY